MRYEMASPKITPQQQRKIEVILESWKGKLTWHALVTKVELDLGIRTTRQTLYSYTSIKLAYKERKALLRGATPSLYMEISSTDVELLDQIENLKAEISVLRRNNAEQLRMIERILSNANDIPNIDLYKLVQPRTEET